MEKIRTSKNEYEVEFVAVGNQTIILKSHNPINDNFSDGFLVYSDETVIDDYSKFNTVYNQIDEYTIELSNDGSVYIEPIVIEPTEEELVEMERQRKLAEISSLKLQLAETDYIFIKVGEYQALGESLPYEQEYLYEISEERRAIRNRINLLEEEISQSLGV